MPCNLVRLLTAITVITARMFAMSDFNSDDIIAARLATLTANTQYTDIIKCNFYPISKTTSVNVKCKLKILVNANSTSLPSIYGKSLVVTHRDIVYIYLSTRTSHKRHNPMNSAEKCASESSRQVTLAL